MARSKREVPHFYLATTVDLGPATEWLAAENGRRALPDRILPAALFLRATVLALKEVPELNAHWTGDRAPPLPEVHLGVAVSLRGGGLVAPAIRDAGRLDLAGVMVAFRDLVERARAGGLRASEMSGGTITVTSLGDRGVEAVWPIIVPPQVATVGFGRVAERPWVVEGRVLPRPVVTVTVAADHRIVDGHRAGRFLSDLGDRLVRPADL
jgi:pyruvate dehydrogenase E2 component (dihydrolipoamide acetyltransferase)